MRAGSAIASGARHSVSALAQAFLLAAIIGALIMAAAITTRTAPGGAASVDAGRSRAWLALSGDARLASSSSTYTVVGGSFVPGVTVSINLAEPGCCRFFNVSPNADGEISFTGENIGPGTYEVRAYQRLNPRKLTLMAGLTFEVGG